MRNNEIVNELEYGEFLEAVKENLKAKMGERVTIKITTVMKNNSVFLDGLSIMKENDNIAPSIYLNDFYQEYLDGEDFSNILKKIIEIYERNKLARPVNLDFFTGFEQVKEIIVGKLINYQKNSELLKKVPHIKVLDLAMVFYCLVSCEVTGNATILIHNSHMKMWNVSPDTLLELAIENTQKLLSTKLQTMEEVLKEMVTEEFREELEGAGQDSYNEMNMFVLTNENKFHGAICILYPDILKKLSEKLERDLYILPSSIHEVIIIPASDYHSPEELKNMVQEVNNTQVSREEILSYEIYFYSREKDELFIK